MIVAVFSLALASRLALPWGPVNFGEAERLEMLWDISPDIEAILCAIPVFVSGLQALKIPGEVILRVAPPVFGALGVLATWLFARSAGLRRENAALAAAVVGTWPAHLHYSTSLTFTIEGTAFWCLAFAVAGPGAQRLPRRIPLLVSLSILAVYARPEYRLMLVPLAVIVAGPGWTHASRLRLGLLLGVAFFPYLFHLNPSAMAPYMSVVSRYFVPRMLVDPAISPVWWIYLGGLGLVLVLGRRQWLNLSLALASATALLMGAYWFLASETNPRWGQWRYYASLIPLVAVAVALVGEQIGTMGARWRRLVVAALFAVAALSALNAARILRRAEDIQSEFAFIRASAPAIVAHRRDVLLLANTGHPGRADVRIEANVALAIGLRHGPFAWPGACDDLPRTLHLRDLERVVHECPDSISPEGSVVYLGLSREDGRLAELLTRFQLIPLAERRLTAALTNVMLNRQCAGQSAFGLDGFNAPPCALRFGWYRLAPLPHRE